MPTKSQFLKGHFLLDSGQLAHSWFARTVVLLCEHNAEGAFGLVLNRAAPGRVGDVLVADLPDLVKAAPLFIGGPVQTSALSFLHSDSYLPDANVMPNLSVGHSVEELVELGGSFSTTSKLKVFAGYAGWSPNQLEGEIKREGWLTCPASLDLVFDVPPDQLWATLLRQIGGWKNRLLASLPENPGLN